jgi:hypothetical protein
MSQNFWMLRRAAPRTVASVCRCQRPPAVRLTRRWLGTNKYVSSQLAQIQKELEDQLRKTKFYDLGEQDAENEMGEVEMPPMKEGETSEDWFDRINEEAEAKREAEYEEELRKKGEWDLDNVLSDADALIQYVFF